MIKANELRIGNLILLKHSSPYAKDEITVVDDYETFYGIFKHPENYEPILLTEEWLLKFGWKKSDLNIDTWWKPGWVINKDQEGNFFVSKDEKVVLKYIHQLQNIYFALTGKELTLKP